MSTNSRFGDMIRSFAPNQIFREELAERDWFVQNVERDDTWLGGELEVRFRGARASSIKFGSLTDSADIAQSTYVKGSVTSQPEVWGSLIFNEKDLMRNGKLNEQNFLKILPDEIEDFVNFMKMALSLSFTNGPKMATTVAGGTAASGIIKVDRVERFEIDQKLIMVDDADLTPDANITCYVTAIDVNGDLLTVSATRGGAGLDVSAMDVGAGLYLDGQESAGNRLTSLKSSLLSAANGGTSSLYGVSKLAYPHTQSINIDGSTITSTNILSKLFEAQTTVRNKGKGNPDTLVMSYRHLGYILAALEASKGAYRQADDMKASLYGWTEVVIVGVKGSLRVVAIQEMDNDYIVVLDKSAVKLYSNGFIKKRVSPDGDLYHVIRNTTGYQYIVDVCFFGDMVLERPSRCGIVYGITA